MCNEPSINRLTIEEIHAKIATWNNLLWKMAQKWHRLFPCVEAEDLRNSAIVGVMLAGLKFDTSRPNQFMTYAYAYATEQIRTAIRNAQGIKKAGNKTTDLVPAIQTVSLGLSGRDSLWANAIPERDSDPHDLSLPEDFWERVKKYLTRRQYAVLRMRNVEMLTLEAVGRRLRVGKSRAQQIETQAIRHLRQSNVIHDPDE